MKILITGGSGFIGTNLMEYYLSKNVELLNVDIKPPKIDSHHKYWKNVDIMDFDLFSRTVVDYSPSYIIHLAARANLTGKHIEDYSTNILGVENLIKISNNVTTIKKVVFTSTMLVCKAGYIPNSDTDYCPLNLYGESKVLGEKLVRESNNSFEWSIIRPTSIWGPWFGKTYRGFFELIMKKQYFNFSGKMSNKSYGYIGNIIYQIDSVLFSELSNKKTLYVADYEPSSIKEWSKEIGNELNIPIITIPRFMIWIAAIIGDVVQKFGFNFPMNSFRLKNMTTDAVFPMTETKIIAPEVRYSRIEGNKLTIKWLKDQSW
jgi:nucleoside-diphosphate-sugar epimerase